MGSAKTAASGAASGVNRKPRSSPSTQAVKAACQMPDRFYFDIDVSGAI